MMMKSANTEALAEAKARERIKSFQEAALRVASACATELRQQALLYNSLVLRLHLSIDYRAGSNGLNNRLMLFKQKTIVTINKVGIIQLIA